MRIRFTAIILLFSLAIIFAQDYGFISSKGKTIQLTGYRTRISNDKRWVIGEGRNEGKLYSITIIRQPDVKDMTSLMFDKQHSVTVTISNEDYSGAHNDCLMAVAR